MRYLSLLTLVAALLSACAGLSPVAGVSRGFDLGPLPVGERQASDVPNVLGDAAFETGGTTTVSGTALIIDATGTDQYSYGLYAFDLPAGYRLVSASIEVQDVTAPGGNGYYIGFADYGGTGRWEWHGPNTDNVSPAFLGSPENYVSPLSQFIFAIVAPHGVKVQFNQCWVQIDIVAIEKPPAGPQTADVSSTLPSLAVLPATAPNIAADAPLIAYTKVTDPDSKLFLAYYNGGEWVHQPIMPQDNFSRALLAWLPSGQGVIVANDLTTGALIDIRVNQALAVTSSTVIMANPGTMFFNASLAYDAASGTLSVAHAYANDTVGQLYYSSNDGSGWQTGPVLYDGDPVAGVVLRPDPLGGDPWLLFAHGTIDRSTLLILTFTLESGRLSGGNWTFTPVSFPYSPLAVDLTFKADGTPQAAFLSARNYNILGIDISLLYDVYAGSYSGGWNFEEVFHGNVSPGIGFPVVPIDIDDGTDVSMAAPDELLFSEVVGTVRINLLTMLPESGLLTQYVHYMKNSGGWSESPADFTGPAGRSFSWGRTASGPAAAYVLAVPLDVTAFLNGNTNQINDIIYWSK